MLLQDREWHDAMLKPNYILINHSLIRNVKTNIFVHKQIGMTTDDRLECLHLISLILLLLEFTLVLGSGVLVLLVLGDEVVHVGLCLGELHLVHALARVPVQESLATEHGRELLRDALEQLLYGRAVADEGRRHFQTTWRDVADGRLDVVWNPLDEVARVLVLNVQHLLVHLTTK